MDDEAAANFLETFAKNNKPGVYLDVPMPKDVPGRVILKDGSIIKNPDRVVIKIRENGSIATGYPQSSKHPH